MRTKTQKALNDIVDTMTGADGGVEFVTFKGFLEEFDRRAVSGDKDAEELINVLFLFDRMIKIANKIAEVQIVEVNKTAGMQIDL